jgi:hypothetical protein
MKFAMIFKEKISANCANLTGLRKTCQVSEDEGIS